MKDNISPPIIAVAVIIVVVLVAIIGFKVFGPEGKGSAEEYKKKYSGQMANSSGTPGSAGSGGTPMERYRSSRPPQ